jgi:OmcA/MtrC family decaheme c-type cytochrome
MVDTTDPANPIIKTTFTPKAGSTANAAYTGGWMAHAVTTSYGHTADNLTYLRFAYARLSPPTPFTTKHSAQWVRYTTGDRDPTHLTDNGDGSYTMATPIPAADYAADMPTRALLMVSKVDGYTAPLNVIYNFVPDGSTPAADVTRNVVTEAACNSCHANKELGSLGISNTHGGSRYLVEACVVCHTDKDNSPSGSGVSVDGRVLSVLIHQVHDAVDSTATTVLGKVAGKDNWSFVKYPQSVKNCAKCHNNDAGDASDFMNYANFPSIKACGSCHSTINFADGTNHPGGIQTDADCMVCHKTGSTVAKSVAQGHDIVPSATATNIKLQQNFPEFKVNLALTPPANGTYYVAGEAPLVTVTLKNQDGTDINPAFYTTAKGVASNTADTALHVAALYVYGPRADSVPVLATDTITDPAYVAPPTQGHDLFVGGTDPQVKTDATGFKYQLLAIPANMTPGTYNVRVRIGDYSCTRTLTNNCYGIATDYKIESLARVNIQIGTATVEPKVSGDACVECHGTGTAPFHDSAHAVYFNTDDCLACHDKSGNYGDYIGNRVHAIHSASQTGDLHNRDWTGVTFPRQVNNCTTCHTNPAPVTPVWNEPHPAVCGGCHGSDIALVPNAQANYPLVDITKQIAAALHMVNNGGGTYPSFDPISTPTPECLVCHGPGRIADPFVTHRLITFPAPVPNGN